MTPSLARRASAEAVGTALLLAGIVGSGIMAQRLASGNGALALLANSLATGGVLVAIILAFGSISGAHFNPAITIADALEGGLAWRDASAYITAQFFGGIAGVGAANVMFGEPVFFVSHHARGGLPALFAEFVATFGLLLVVWGCSRYRSNLTAVAVASYIVGAYWFTASTSFANPAVAIARSLSDTFAGIAPADVPGFIVAEFAGALAATAFVAWLWPRAMRPAAVVVPHDSLRRRSSRGMKQPVLFVCVHNSARSQMAQAFLNACCPDDFVAESAGLEPGTLNPLAIEAMREVGIDISHNATKSAFDLYKAGKAFAYVITVCDEASAERCPVFPGTALRLNWSFPDPASFQGTWEERMAQTRAVRDAIRAKIGEFCSEAFEAA
jgi:glycerol uptake facilitator-like aquaporin